MSPMALPRNVLDNVLNDLLEFEKQLNSPHTDIYRETFQSMLSRPVFSEKYDNYISGAQQGKARLQNIARFRKDGTIAVTIEEILYQAIGND